jgi:signal transduction histidine kinase
MVPIRTLDPVGAIGNYWAKRHRPDEHEVELLQALADSTAVAIENVRIYEELEQRVADRTAELQARTRELEETNRSIRSLHAQTTRSFEALRERSRHHLQVLHTLAHEVRSPLAAGQGILRLALSASASVDERTRADLTDVDAAVSEAIDVVNRQLEAARLEAGAIAIRVEKINVAGELASLRAMFRAFARSNDVELVIEQPDGAVALCTDRALLGHILRNLIANALKFTDAGEVRVSAGRGAGGGVRFVVADTGIGIAAEQLERLFQEWEQVDAAQDDRPAGSGLGLALVRRLVEKLGGRIDVDSEPGTGSTFAVTLPTRAPAPL